MKTSFGKDFLDELSFKITRDGTSDFDLTGLIVAAVKSYADYRIGHFVSCKVKKEPLAEAFKHNSVMRNPFSNFSIQRKGTADSFNSSNSENTQKEAVNE